MSDFTEELKEKDPEFKTYCEETLTITREDFNRKIANMIGIDSKSHFIEIVEVGSFINKLWHCLMEVNDND